MGYWFNIIHGWYIIWSLGLKEQMLFFSCFFGIILYNEYENCFQIGGFMRNSYQTKQKSELLSCIQKQVGEFTIQDLYEATSGSIGLTTIYRYIHQLIDERKILSMKQENQMVYYQYLESCNCQNHFYLKCEKCGQLIHVDCDWVEELVHHIQKDHQFQLNREHIIMNGICQKCLKKGENVVC